MDLAKIESRSVDEFLLESVNSSSIFMHVLIGNMAAYYDVDR